MANTTRCLILLVFLFACAAGGQVVRVQGLRSSGAVNADSGTVTNGLNTLGGIDNSGGTTNRGLTATRQAAPFLLSGGFAIAPNTNTALTINVSTNPVQCYTTNASFTVTYTGTAPDGARGEFRVWNTAAADVTLTWPVSYSKAQGAGITSINLVSNSVTVVRWEIVSGSNYVDVIQKDAYQLGILNPSVGQVLAVHCTSCGPGGSMIFTNITVAGSGDVTAAASFATDNRIIRSDGTGKGVQASGISLDDSSNLGTPGNLGGATIVATNTITIPNGTADVALGAVGQIHLNETDEQLGVHSGSNGEISGEAAISLILTKSWTFDPKAVCDGAVDRLFLMKIGDEAPEGIIIDEWLVSFEADPTTEADLDLKYADAMIGVANPVLIDVLDTTTGTSTEDTDANINGGSAIPNGKVMYLEFGTAYTETTHQIMFQIWYHYEED